MTSLSTEERDDILKHILTLIQDEQDHIFNILKGNGISLPSDLYIVSQSELTSLTIGRSTTLKEFNLFQVKWLLLINEFHQYRHCTGNPLSIQDWASVTSEEFEEFRVNPSQYAPATTVPV